jgi:hypothetical protein
MADENYHQGPTIDKGIAAPNSSGGGDDRLQGLTSMTPIAGKGATTTARASVNSSADVVTSLARAKLNEIGPATVNVRNMIKRKR